MPVSVSLSELSWSTPDGTPLFSDLNLAFGPERTGIVGVDSGRGQDRITRHFGGGV